MNETEFEVSIAYKEDLLLELDQVYYCIYNSESIIIYLNMDVTPFGTFSHMIIMMWKSGSTCRERGWDIH
jgi:hypothetical protein